MLGQMQAVWVRDHRPLQQGLRLTLLLRAASICEAVRDHRPLQQGLRRNNWAASLRLEDVRDHRPLQQGLRPFTVFCSFRSDMYETIVHYNKD